MLIQVHTALSLGSRRAEPEAHELQTKALKHQVAIHGCITAQDLAPKWLESSPTKSGCPGGGVEQVSAAYPHMKNANLILGSTTVTQVKGVITASTTHSWNRISNTVTSFGLPKPRQQHSGVRPVEGHQDCQRLDSQHKRRKIAQFLKKRIAQGDDTEIYNCLLRICRGGWARLLGGIQQKDTDNNKCATMETSTIKGEYFFLLRVVKHCNRSLQILEIFNPAILKAFKAQPHKAQSKLL